MAIPLRLLASALLLLFLANPTAALVAFNIEHTFDDIPEGEVGSRYPYWLYSAGTRTVCGGAGPASTPPCMVGNAGGRIEVQALEAFTTFRAWFVTGGSTVTIEGVPIGGQLRPTTSCAAAPGMGRFCSVSSLVPMFIVTARGTSSWFMDNAQYRVP